MTCAICRNADELGAETFGICSNCLIKLMMFSPEQLQQAYDLAMQHNFLNKARVIKEFSGVEYGRKTKNIERSLERKRPMPAARPSRDQMRA